VSRGVGSHGAWCGGPLTSGCLLRAVALYSAVVHARVSPALLLTCPTPTPTGRQQLQSTTDKLKTMAVKRESMRQQSFKQAADGAAAAAVAVVAAGGAPDTLHEGEDEGV
jgi:hypothetical protein